MEQNYRCSDGNWLIIPKKGVQRVRLEYGAAVEETLCFGWIDSKPRELDAERYMAWFVPRRRGSAWSALNRRRNVSLNMIVVPVVMNSFLAIEGQQCSR